LSPLLVPHREIAVVLVRIPVLAHRVDDHLHEAVLEHGMGEIVDPGPHLGPVHLAPLLVQRELPHHLEHDRVDHAEPAYRDRDGTHQLVASDDLDGPVGISQRRLLDEGHAGRIRILALDPVLLAARSDQVHREHGVADRRELDVATVGARRDHPAHCLPAGAAERGHGPGSFIARNDPAQRLIGVLGTQGMVPAVEYAVQLGDAHARLDVDNAELGLVEDRRVEGLDVLGLEEFPGVHGEAVGDHVVEGARDPHTVGIAEVVVGILGLDHGAGAERGVGERPMTAAGAHREVRAAVALERVPDDFP
jgi:hypothetical protein